MIPDLLDPEHKGWINAEGVEVPGIFEPTHSILAVPLLIADHVRGTIAFISSRPGSPFDERHVAVAEAVARQAATAIEHSSIFARERATTERFRYLAHATDQLFASGDLRTNLDTLVKSLVGYWADWAILYRIDDEGAVRVQSVSYCDPTTAFVEELRGQRLFHPAAERGFLDVVAKHRSRLRTDVTVESVKEILQPFLRPIVEQMRIQSLARHSTVHDRVRFRSASPCTWRGATTMSRIASCSKSSDAGSRLRSSTSRVADASAG